MVFSTSRGAMAVGAAGLATAITAVVAGAQQPKPCTLVCAPTVAFNVAAHKSHVFGSPTVHNDTTGALSKLPSQTNLELQFFIAAKTQVERLSVFAAATWLPSAKTRANPFTEYTASQVGDDIRSNTVTLTMGGIGEIVPKKMTKGYLALDAYVADLLSPAARPDDASSYTHKLDLGAYTVLYPFAGADSSSAPRKSGFYLFATLDYVATGLPKAGDDVPKGVRTFVTNAKPAALIAGVGIPIAPLFQAK